MFSRRAPLPPSKIPNTPRPSGWWRLLVTSSVVVYPFLLLASLQTPLTFGLERWLPFSLQSKLNADYRRDTLDWSAPQADTGLIQEALADQQMPDSGILATLNASLSTPVFTVTPEFPPLVLPSYTATPMELTPAVTATRTPSATTRPTQTSTPTSLATSTIEFEAPPASPTATSTVVRPRATKTQTAEETQPPAPSPTQLPTVNPPSPTPSAQPTSKPSDTPLPYP